MSTSASFTPVRHTLTVETPEQHEAETSQGIGDGLAFSPWHGLAAQLRAGFNHCPIHEAVG